MHLKTGKKNFTYKKISNMHSKIVRRYTNHLSEKETQIQKKKHKFTQKQEKHCHYKNRDKKGFFTGTKKLMHSIYKVPFQAYLRKFGSCCNDMWVFLSCSPLLPAQLHRHRPRHRHTETDTDTDTDTNVDTDTDTQTQT